MFQNRSKKVPIGDAASRASKRSEKPAKRPRAADRSCPGARVDAVTELDRGSWCGPNPNSRMNAPPITRRRSSHPQGREAIMMDTTTVHSDPSSSDPSSPDASSSDASSPVAGIDVAKDKLDVFIDSTTSSPPQPQQQQRFSLANSAEQIARLIE